MKIKKYQQFIIAVFLIFALAIGLTSISHPIVLKWLTGSARVIGKPIHATVYTDGHINHGITVVHVAKYWDSNEKANTYLLRLTTFDSLGNLKFLNVNLSEKWIGRPVGTSKRDYDLLMGRLFHSETGGHFVAFEHTEKGYNFDPQLSFTQTQIKFNVPSNALTFDSVRIELK